MFVHSRLKKNLHFWLGQAKTWKGHIEDPLDIQAYEVLFDITTVRCPVPTTSTVQFQTV